MRTRLEGTDGQHVQGIWGAGSEEQGRAAPRSPPGRGAVDAGGVGVRAACAVSPVVGGSSAGRGGGTQGAKPLSSPPARLALPGRRSREDTQPLAALPAARREASAAIGASKAPRCALRGDRGQGSRAAGTRGARRPETRPRLLSFQRLDFLERTPFGFAIFTRPSLPVSMATPPNSRFQAAMTSPFPFLPPRPPGAAGPTPSRAPLRPGRAPTPLPSPGRGVPRAPAPLPARRRGLGGPRGPSPQGGCAGAPVAEGTGPGRPSLPLRDPCHAGRPVGAARALAAGEAGAGRRQASLAAGVAARLAWEAPAAPSSETGDLRQRGSEVAGEPQGPVARSAEPLPLCPWASEPPPAWWQSCPGLSWAMRCTPGS